MYYFTKARYSILESIGGGLEDGGGLVGRSFINVVK